MYFITLNYFYQTDYLTKEQHKVVHVVHFILSPH